MAVQGSLVQACAVALLLQLGAAHVYDTSLNLNRRQDGVLVLEGSPGAGADPDASQASPNSTGSQQYTRGFIALSASIVGFGSSLVPVKRTDTGDGMFFQWVFCSTMWLESLLVHFTQGSSETWLLSVLAGCLFGIANLTTIPIIRTIGLGLGYLIWSTFCLLMGWASGRFGWFGLDPQDVASPVLNYIGTALAAVSVVVLFFIKTEEKKEDEPADDVEPLFESHSDKSPDNQLASEADECVLADCGDKPWEEKLSPLQRKIMGCTLATFAGLLYGCCYTPIIYVKNSAVRNSTHFRGASQYDLDYIFPFMNGACATTSLAFFVYCAVLKNRPHLPAKCVLPAFVSGSLQFGSQISWFLSCYYVGSIITYSIGTAGPALVSLSWSVFYFREIKGFKNFMLLGAVLITVLTGITLITVSKIK